MLAHSLHCEFHPASFLSVLSVVFLYYFVQLPRASFGIQLEAIPSSRDLGVGLFVRQTAVSCRLAVGMVGCDDSDGHVVGGGLIKFS